MALIEELKEITNGIYVLTARRGDVRHGMSSSWVTQVSGEPPLIAASIDRAHVSHGRVRVTHRFGLSVVGTRNRRLEDLFYSKAAKAENNASPTLHVGRVTVPGNGGWSSIPPQQRKSIAIRAAAPWKPYTRRAIMRRRLLMRSTTPLVSRYST